MGTVKTTTNSDGSTTTSKLRFSYDADGKVVAVNYNGNYYYYLRNAQSDIVKLIDKTGATVVEYTYDSWGKLLSTSGSLASTLGKNNPFRYRGYVYDEETGFYYLQSRYYNPEVGRFISSDVLLSTGQGVLGHNAYAYCGNNPVCRSDASGYKWWEDAWNWVCGAAQDVGEFISDNIGLETHVEVTHREIELKTLLAGYEYGESGSWSCGANSDKPIVLYAKKASQWWRVWEYSVGIKLNIGDGGASLEVGAGHASMSASITGNSSIAVSADIERVSVTLSNEIDWKNNTYGEYHQYFLRPWTVGPTAYAVVTSLPVIASILAGVGAGVGAVAGLSPALIP